LRTRRKRGTGKRTVRGNREEVFWGGVGGPLQKGDKESPGWDKHTVGSPGPVVPGSCKRGGKERGRSPKGGERKNVELRDNSF